MHSSCTAVISQSENKRKFENRRKKAVRRARAVRRQYDAAPRQLSRNGIERKREKLRDERDKGHTHRHKNGHNRSTWYNGKVY